MQPPPPSFGGRKSERDANDEAPQRVRVAKSRKGPEAPHKHFLDSVLQVRTSHRGAQDASNERPVTIHDRWGGSSLTAERCPNERCVADRPCLTLVAHEAYFGLRRRLEERTQIHGGVVGSHLRGIGPARRTRHEIGKKLGAGELVADFSGLAAQRVAVNLHGAVVTSSE